MYVAAVDGNGGAGTTANDEDPYDDDTVSANFFLQEANVPVKNDAAAGCSLAPGAGAPSLFWLCATLLLVIRRERWAALARAADRAFRRRHGAA